MVGKYVGTLMPTVFGLYGIFSLFDQFSKTQALIYLFQMVVILYPSFTVFAIVHGHFIQRNVEGLSKKLFREKGKRLYDIYNDAARASEPDFETPESEVVGK